MKQFCILSLLFCSLITSYSQVVDSTELDYVSLDTIKFSVTPRQCGRIIRISTRRAENLRKRIASTNNMYLHQFQKLEDGLLYSLCSLPNKEDTSLDTYSTENAEKNMESIQNNSRLYPQQQPALLPNNLQIPNSDKIFSQHSFEASADALITNAWHSFNRFENKFEREKSRPLKNPITDLNSKTTELNYITSQEKCGCSDTEFIKAKENLEDEIKRSELIREYINERETHLSNVLAGINGSDALLLPIRKNNYYFKTQLSEHISFLSDKSLIERWLSQNLSITPDFQDYVSQLKTTTTSVSNTTSKLTIEELLSNAPAETATALSNITIQNTPASQAVNNIAKTTAALTSANQELKAALDSKIETSPEIKDSTVAPKTKNEEAWKPNPLKTKRYVDRIKFGSNLQVDPRTSSYPKGLCLSGYLSYQFQTNGNIGIGTTLIQPTPTQWPSKDRPITFPSQSSCGVRSFVDYKIKSQLFVLGGYEVNYRTRLNNNTPSSRNEMQRSAMLGVKFRYSSSNPQSRPTVEMLYDFLHKQTGQPAFVVRMGVEFSRKHGLK